MRLALCAAVCCAASAQELANYVLRANDRIEVRVFQEEDLTQVATVSQDGTVRLSLVGSVAVAGLTTDQAAERIRQAYHGDYLVKPQVTVSVLQFSKRRVVIMGQVGRPGPVELRAGERTTLVQAIGEAGGFTRLANQRAVFVKRTAGAQERTFKIDVRQMSTDAGIAPFYLEEGDVVTVKEALF